MPSVRRLRARHWLLVTTLAIGCNSAPQPSSGETTASSASPAPPPTTTAASTAGPSATKPAAATDDLAGAWEGRYEAKKGSVALPPRVKDKAIAADDGKAAAGPGAVEITVQPSGDVTGKTTGAPGPGGISGKVDGRTLRTVVRPDDPASANAMTGIFIGERKGDVIACELHVAGPDGTVIRESTVELRRKK